MPNILNKVTSDKLLSLIQTENYVGRIYSIDYENALVLTNDAWKQKVNGVPQNAFLIATTIEPSKYNETDEFDKEVILLRVNGSCKLPQDDDNIRTKLDSIQNKTATYTAEQPDVLTQNLLQFSGLHCRVLGTFYMKNQELQLGSDIENFSSSLTQAVYLPKGEALKTIVNYVDPIRANKSKEDFKKMGIECEVEPFEIGTVRYTSSDRLQRREQEDLVPVVIQPADFLARRTAVLGMTRTGKSNMVKQTVSVVKKVSNDANLKIGQLIFDINGEYANANNQDNGAISDIFKDDCVRYRMMKTENFESLLTNFYEQLEDGFQIISEVVKEEKASIAQDITTFINSFSTAAPEEEHEKKRYNVKIALYKALLYKSGFATNGGEKVFFEANKGIVQLLQDEDNIDDNESSQDTLFPQDEVSNKINVKNPKLGLSIKETLDWFSTLREKAVSKAEKINKEKNHSENKKLWFEMLPSSTKGKLWLDDVCVAMLNMIAQKNSSNSPMYGYKCLFSAIKYHTAERKSPVSKEIYDYLNQGKIVILDLSVGIATMREKISTDLAKYIFNTSMNSFTKGDNPPYIMIYIEEAHNLIGKGMPLTDMWPRIAKEGAKYKIGLVYATQEVSSVHPNILSNTENWFVSHLNSENEIKELDKFYDFADFHKSLLRAQDVGFTRVKTLSSSFVVPVQINKFDPEKWRNK